MQPQIFTEEERMEIIPIASVKTNPYQPRKSFSQEALAELAASIRRYGLLQPITVRKSRGSYELIAGERRLRASKLAGMSTIKAVIIPGMADRDSAMLAMIENLQRENLSFFEEAEGYQSLIRGHGMTQEELARRLSKNQSTVANKLRILKLPAKVRERIIHHGLTERHARTLLRLHDEAAQLTMIDRIVREGLSVKATESLVEKELMRLYDSPEDETAVKKQGEDIAESVRRFLSGKKLGYSEETHGGFTEFRIRVADARS